MGEAQLRRLMMGLLRERFGSDHNLNFSIDHEYLETVFPDFFSLIHSQLKGLTSSFNEYNYIFSFLYPEYMSPAYKIASESITGDSYADQNQVKKCINKRGVYLATKNFKILMGEVLSNLYLHASSKEDLQKDVVAKSEENWIKNTERRQDERDKVIVGEKRVNMDTGFKFTEITYLQDSRKNVNFSFMQSLALITAYVAGSNKESLDLKLFERDKARMRIMQQRQGQEPKKLQ